MISRNGETTNSFVEIKKSENNEEYIIFPDNPHKKENISLISRVDEADINHVEEGSHVNMYLSGQSCPLLEDNIVLVDSPGIDSGIEIDKNVQEECKKADVLILVISCSSGFSEKEKEFLKKYKTHFMNFKIIFLLNFSDTIWNKYEYYKDKFNKEVNEYLQDIYNEKTDKDERIFFISAIERLKCQNKESISKDGWQRRNEDFEDFEKCLKTYQNQSIKKKHLELKKHNIEGIKNMYEEIKKAKYDEESKFMENIKSIMKNENIKEIIKNEIGLLFKEINEKLVLKGQIEIEKLNEKDETIIEDELYISDRNKLMEIKKSYEKIDEKLVLKGQKQTEKLNEKKETIIKDELYIFDRNELMEIIKSYESKIMNIIKTRKFQNEYQIMKILETIYFPLYFNFIEDLKEEDIKMLCSDYKEMIINQKAEEKSEVELENVAASAQNMNTTGLVGAGLTTVGGAVVVGTAGAVGAAGAAGGTAAVVATDIIAPIVAQAALRAGGIALGAAAGAGGVALAIGSAVVIAYYKHKLRCSEKEKELIVYNASCKNKCEEHKKIISSFWKEKEELMINSYQTFLDTMKISMPFEDDFKTFKEFVKNLI